MKSNSNSGVLVKRWGPYHIGSAVALKDRQAQQLIERFERPSGKSFETLGGRIPVIHLQIEELGPVVVKCYARGGFIRFLIKRRYLRWGKTRSQREYEFLLKVRNLGINAPEPLAFAFCGRLFYRAWLVTHEIPQPRSLAQLSVSDPEKARRVFNAAADQISLLIQNAIMHMDLHPGNVMADLFDRVYLLDFDKGHIFTGDQSRLCSHYLARWERAVKKHGLPEVLSQMMRAKLCNHNDAGKN